MLGSACQLWIFPNFQMIQRTSEDQTWASHVKSTTAADNTLTIPQFSSKVVIFNDGSDFMNQPIQGLPWRHLYLLHYWRQPLFRYSRDGARTTRKLLLRFFFPWVFSGAVANKTTPWNSHLLIPIDPWCQLWTCTSELDVRTLQDEILKFSSLNVESKFMKRISGHPSSITGISMYFEMVSSACWYGFFCFKSSTHCVHLLSLLNGFLWPWLHSSLPNPPVA